MARIVRAGGIQHSQPVIARSRSRERSVAGSDEAPPRLPRVLAVEYSLWQPPMGQGEIASLRSQ